MRIFKVRCRRRRTGQKGFATVEVLVAVAVIVIVGTLGFLTFGNRDTARLRSEAADVALFLQQARLRAAESGQPVAVAFDDRSGALTSGTRSYVLDGGVRGSAAPARLRIAPSGENDGLILTLAAGDARTRVRLDWLTGRVEVGP